LAVSQEFDRFFCLPANLLEENNAMHWGKYIALFVGISVAIFVCASVGGSAPLMVEKNLFSQDRKPPPPDAGTQTPQKSSSGLSVKSIQLDGVMIYGKVKKALVRIKGQSGGAQQGKGKSPFMTAQEGEKIGDFQVVKIEPKSISLEKDGQVFVVDLFAEGKVVPPAPAAPPPVASIPPAPGQSLSSQLPTGSPPSQVPQATFPQPPSSTQRPGAVMPNIPIPPNAGNQAPVMEVPAPEPSAAAEPGLTPEEVPEPPEGGPGEPSQ
jgi:hypothetical protein